jgi:hypothetical protein
MGLKHYSSIKPTERDRQTAVNLAAQLVLQGTLSVEQVCILCGVDHDEVERNVADMRTHRAVASTQVNLALRKTTLKIRQILGRSWQLLADGLHNSPQE